MDARAGCAHVKAAVYDRYGPPEVLRIEEVERPVPGDDEVLVKIRAGTVNRTDTGFRSAEYFLSRLYTGVRRPRRRILGSEFAGEIEAIGSAITEFAVGDRVFGVNVPNYGTHAEFVAVRESAPIAPMPAGMTFEQAAAVCDGAMLAIGLLRRAGPLEGRRVLVYGASGAIGTAAVQLAKHLGAHVTAVCNTKNVEIVSSLGADEVIDYEREDFTKNSQSYDVIFDSVGKHSFRKSRDSLNPGGIFLVTDGFVNFPLALWTWKIGDKRVVWDIPPRYRKQDVVFFKELIEAGEYRPVIDRTYPLDDVVEATKYVETGQKTGNVVLTVATGA